MSPQLSRVRTQVRGNSLEAFASVPIARRQRQTLEAIAELYREGRQPSDQDTAAHLRWPINCVTGRRCELVQAGKVVKGGNKIAETGRRVSWWRPSSHQLDLFVGSS